MGFVRREFVVRYVGIDQSYRNTGIVILDETLTPVLTQNVENPWKSITENPQGFMWHRKLAEDQLQKNDVVCIEGLGFGRGAYAQQGAAVYAFWMEVAYRKCDFLFIVPPLRVKMWAVGDTKANKMDMKHWAAEELGRPNDFRRVSQHVADALAIAQVGQHAYQYLMKRELSIPEKHKARLIHNSQKNGTADAQGKFYFEGLNGA